MNRTRPRSIPALLVAVFATAAAMCDGSTATAAKLPLLPGSLHDLGRAVSLATSPPTPPVRDLTLPSGTWVDVNLGSTYYNRYAHAAVFDPVRSRLLVFGGYNGSDASSEVWALSLSGSPTWTLVNATGGPPGSWYLHTAIYDPVRDRMIVFGGIGGDGGYTSGVWALSLSGIPSWSQLTPLGTAPSQRIYHTAIYDPVRDRMLVFGGFASSALDDVWSLSLSGSPTWTQLTPTGSPGRRFGHTAIYDPVGDRMIVFGGFTEPTNMYVNDVWALSLDNLTWAAMPATGTPPATGFRASAIYDPGTARMVVFGGYDGGASAISDDVHAFAIAGSSWTPIIPSGSAPRARYLHTAVYGAGQMVLFGGVADDGSFLRDADALSLSGSPAWSALPDLGGTGPGGRGDRPVTVYDSARDKIVTFGGSTGSSSTNEVWVLPFSGTPAWTELVTVGTPPAGRTFSSGIYDPIRDRVIVFGGMTSGNTNDVWELTLNGTPTWTELIPSGSAPDPRFGHTAIYDPVRDRMVVYGGYGAAPLGDVWSLSLSGTPAWTQLTPSGIPPNPRYFHSAIYDPLSDRMLIAHGNTVSGNPDDVWELSLASTAWNQLAPGGSLPGGRYLASAIYDPNRERMVMFGGYDPLFGPVNSTWELTLSGSPAWTQLVPFGSAPLPRYGHGAIYDPVRDRMAVFGASFYYTDDVRALNFATGYTVDVQITGNGSVTKSPDQPAYLSNTSVQLTATPEADWHFVSWSGDISTTTNPVTLTVTQDRAITAIFAANTTYTLSVGVAGSGSVAKTPDLASYEPGSMVQLTATPGSGYHFVGWSGDAGGASNPLTVVMDGNKSITATFALNGAGSMVISQIYGGGGNSGAQYHNDYIELFNRGAVSVNVTGWSVQYAPATGSTWSTTTLSGTVPAGGYYLIQEAAGTGGGATLPTPDATGGIPMSATQGKVALVASVTALTGSCPTGGVILDLVGYGAANCFETSSTGVLTNTTADFRNQLGCIDTGNNAADFTIAAPAPRNSASALHLCEGTASDTLVIVVDPPGAGSVTKDPDLEVYPYGSSVQITAVPASGYHFVHWTGDATATANPQTVVMNANKSVVAHFEPNAPGGIIVISQIYGGGGNAGAHYSNDFVELFNRGNIPVDITGWSVQYASVTGTVWFVTTLLGSIPPGGYYLVQEAAGSGGGPSLPAPDAVGSIAMAAGAGKVALVNNNVPLNGSCLLGPSVMDVLGYGGADCSETAPTGALDNATADFRRNGGCLDTGNNLSDFTRAAPLPRNSSTPISPCSYWLAVEEASLTEFSLGRPTPNPVHGTMRVPFILQRDADVRLEVLDIQGRVVATLLEGTLSAGRHEAMWTGAAKRGMAKSGVYLVRMQAVGQSFVRRVTVTR